MGDGPHPPAEVSDGFNQGPVSQRPPRGEGWHKGRAGWRGRNRGCWGGINLRTLALSAYDENAFVFGLLSAGATGYVLKEEALDTIVEAIRAASREELWLSKRVQEKVVRKAVGDRKRFPSPNGSWTSCGCWPRGGAMRASLRSWLSARDGALSPAEHLRHGLRPPYIGHVTCWSLWYCSWDSCLLPRT